VQAGSASVKRKRLGIPPLEGGFLFVLGGIADEPLLKIFVFLSVNGT